MTSQNHLRSRKAIIRQLQMRDDLAENDILLMFLDNQLGVIEELRIKGSVLNSKMALEVIYFYANRCGAAGYLVAEFRETDCQNSQNELISIALLKSDSEEFGIPCLDYLLIKPQEVCPVRCSILPVI